MTGAVASSPAALLSDIPLRSFRRFLMELQLRMNKRLCIPAVGELHWLRCPAAALFAVLLMLPRVPATYALVYRPVIPAGNPKYILTPPESSKPHFNNASTFGVRPGSPFLFTLAVSGVRPMRFSAAGLPTGLRLDPTTGRITGEMAASQIGSHVVKIRAVNASGSATGTLTIVLGNTISLTPPMGWNSWNCWAGAVNQARVLAAAKAMVSSGLINYGWTYICIDDTWQAKRGGAFNAIQPIKSRFPGMRALADKIHGMGLKFGIYSTPWTTSYAGHAGGSSMNKSGTWHRPTVSKKGRLNRNILPWAIGKYHFENQDARQWAAWGVDYLKYDWNPIRNPEVHRMYQALRHSGRDIVLSLSNSSPFKGAATWIPDANLWRITGDSRDNWSNLRGHWQAGVKWAHLQRPGHWNDPDMMTIGWVGWGKHQHYTHLTPNEQYLEISGFALMGAPLILGNNLSRMGAFTRNLLTNPEVIAVDQDPLGAAGGPVSNHGIRQVWAKHLADGSVAVGLFNLGSRATNVTAAWRNLHLHGRRMVRDLWRRKNVGTAAHQVTARVGPHGVVLLRIFK